MRRDYRNVDWIWRERQNRYQHGSKSLYKKINDDGTILYYSYSTCIAKVMNDRLFLTTNSHSVTTARHKGIVKRDGKYSTLMSITPNSDHYSSYMENLNEREIMNITVLGDKNG